MMNPTLMTQAVDKAFAWLKSEDADRFSLPLLADDAWLHQLLLFRIGASEPERSKEWQAVIADRLERFKRLDPVIELQGNTVAHVIQCADELMGYLMLVHLLHRYEPDAPATTHAKEKLQQLFEKHVKVVKWAGFLYSFMYQYNFEQMGMKAPIAFDLSESYEHYPPDTAFTIKSYYYTHIIFADCHMLELPSLNASAYSEILSYIDNQADAVMRNGMHDLAAEFILCLAVCGQQTGNTYSRLIEHLLHHQAEDGSWSHSAYDLRIRRHCAFLTIISLMDALSRRVASA